MATASTSPSAPTLSHNSKRTSLLSSLSYIALKNQHKPNLFTKSSHKAFTQKPRTSQLESVGTTASDEYGDIIRRLQNVSDVRRTVDLTPQAAQVIAESFGEWVTERVVRDKKDGGGDMAAGSRVHVSLGRDPRLSGHRLATGIFSGLAKAGCVVVDMGLATTPACFMSTVLTPFNYDASLWWKTRNHV